RYTPKERADCSRTALPLGNNPLQTSERSADSNFPEFLSQGQAGPFLLRIILIITLFPLYCKPFPEENGDFRPSRTGSRENPVPFLPRFHPGTYSSFGT
ncbi:MAG: hypothetical protein ACI406_13305, partial [Victivallis vadensis]